MNDLATTETTATAPVSAATLEHVLGTGDLSRLTPAQRVEYMLQTCRTLGINPLTRPFRFFAFQNQISMYATKDCADQLRSQRKISLDIIERKYDQGAYVVTVRASTPDGRHDEDIGAVPLAANAQGEYRSNALMKATTKAKRRVTLSFCGLGFMDEMEVDSIVGASTFDAEAPAPQQAQQAPAYANETNEAALHTHDAFPFVSAKGTQLYGNAAQWQERWRRLIEACQRTPPNGLDKLADARELNADALATVARHAPDAAREVTELLALVLDRDPASNSIDAEDMPPASEDMSLPP